MATKHTQSDSAWDYYQLTKFGANKEFIDSLHPTQARELVKNILYAIERSKSAQEDGF
jgi:hypothetical protein